MCVCGRGGRLPRENRFLSRAKSVVSGGVRESVLKHVLQHHSYMGLLFGAKTSRISGSRLVTRVSAPRLRVCAVGACKC